MASLAATRKIHGAYVGAILAFLIALPCLFTLGELAYLAHPTRTHRFGETVGNLVWFDRPAISVLGLTAVLLFFGMFTLIQEACLGRWPLRGRTWDALKPGVAVVMSITTGLTLLVLIPQLIHTTPTIFLSIFLFLLPWIAYAYLVRSVMARLVLLPSRLFLLGGSLLAALVAIAAYAWIFGVGDGEVQGMLAYKGSIPVVSILAGGIAECVTQKEIGEERIQYETASEA